LSAARQFYWDAENTAHIARHGVTREEVEQVVVNDPITVAVQFRNDEERFLCAGRTKKGRPIQLVYTIRKGRIRVVTAHTANKKLRKLL
jgi:uncharacterized DUF497 family protein